jgi:hypothetical protein
MRPKVQAGLITNSQGIETVVPVLNFMVKYDVSQRGYISYHVSKLHIFQQNI